MIPVLILDATTCIKPQVCPSPIGKVISEASEYPTPIIEIVPIPRNARPAVVNGIIFRCIVPAMNPRESNHITPVIQYCSLNFPYLSKRIALTMEPRTPAITNTAPKILLSRAL